MRPAKSLRTPSTNRHSPADPDPEVSQDDKGRWHIRDYGRGLRYEHLTQSEDDEKLANPDTVIGKFGVGLKDALATYHRHGIDVTIHSAHNTFTIEEAPKHGFEEISTLHVTIEPPQKDIDGTDVVLDGISENAIADAKSNFIRYSDLDLLESTGFGDVYQVQHGEDAGVYVTGLKVAEEPNFLFSYDITNTTKKIRDVTVYENEYNDSFEFDWVDESALTTEELAAWDSRDEILEIVGRPQNYEYRIASQFRATDDDQTRGSHEPGEQRIIIHRNVLSDHAEFIGVFLHELAHTKTPFPDQTREFENALTELLGEVGVEALS